MKIIDTVRKFPAGMQVIPLLMAATVNTFAPQALEIGGFTSGLFSSAGAPTAVGMFMFCSGATIDFKEMGEPFSKGFALLFTKLALGTGLGLLVGSLFGAAGVFGLTPLVIIAATTNSNGVMYGVLAKKFGVPNDVGAIAPLAFNDGPFFTMLILGGAGMATIPTMSLVAALIPLFLGMILANLDNSIRKLTENAAPFLIPFNGWTLGAGMTWGAVIEAGFSGVLLGIVTMLLTGLGGFFVFNWLFRRGDLRPLATGSAVGNTAGNGIATPLMVAQADPTLASMAPLATAQVATSVVTTAILNPIMTAYLDKKITEKYGELDRTDFEETPEW